METIIRKREKSIGIVVLVIYFLYALIDMTEGSFDSKMIEQISNLKIHFYGYGVAIILLSLRVVREVLLYTRINEDENTLISRATFWFEIVKLTALITGHVLFWISILYEFDIFMSFIFMIIGLALPSMVSAAVYGTEKYIIYDGKKYYFDEISEIDGNIHSGINVIVDGKKHSMTFWDTDECDKIFDYMTNRIEDKRIQSRKVI